MLYETTRPDLRLADVMSRPALSVLGGAGVYECAQMMLARGVHRLVVVDCEGRPLGVITPTDIMRGMVNLQEGFRVRPEPAERDRR